MNRVGQFFRAMGARLTEEDLCYIRKHLPPEGQTLFFRMNLADQYHALRVAHTAEALADQRAERPDREFLIRCALLHDVGRTREDMGVFGKVFAVLMHSFAPNASKRWARKGKRHIYEYPGHVMHVYYHHPAIGAELLEEAGFLEEAAVVRFHHRPPEAGDSLVLQILRKADEMN